MTGNGDDDTGQRKMFADAAKAAGCDTEGAGFSRALDRLVPIGGDALLFESPPQPPGMKKASTGSDAK